MRRTVSPVLLALAATVLSAPLHSQNEATLRSYFEGHSVVVKIDMPADSSGAEVHPDEGRPVDYSRVGNAIKQYGVGVYAGQSVLVTRVKVKKRQISFQLGGGGFGTFSDLLALGLEHADAVPQYEGKTDRERDLEAQLQWEQDPFRRDDLRRELDREREARRRDSAWANEEAASAAADQRADEQAQRARGGSRFTIRYKQPVRADQLTPESVMAVLSEYVDFDGSAGTSSTARTSDALNASDRAFAERGERDGAVDAEFASAGGITSLQKGQTVAQVERLLGPATSARPRQEAGLEIEERSYSAEGHRVTARFVSGVLVDYVIEPE